MTDADIITNLKSEIRILKDKLIACNAAFSNIVEKNRDGILIFDNTGKIIYANPAALDMFGKNLGSLLGEQIGIFINTDKMTEITIINHTMNTPLTVEVNIGETTWNNNPAKIASLRDITEHKKLKNALERLSYFDYLTHLANRVSFEEALKKALSRADRNNTKVALFYLDLNGFKKINDNYGHQVGDQLLVIISNFIKSAVRQEDTVARLGGDEFAIIVEDCSDSKNIMGIIDQILEKTNPPIVINENTFYINFSIGIAIYPDNSNNLDDLIKFADEAMYTAKKSKITYKFY